MDKQVIQAALKNNVCKATHNYSQIAWQRQNEIVRMASSQAEMLRVTSPSKQVEIARDTDRCYFGNAPTMAELNAVYGEGTSISWLIPQLADLSEYVGARDKMDDGKIKQLSAIITNSYPFLKMSELMLFFYRFKAGDYEQFYGSVDPMAITRSLKQFLEDRAAAYDKRRGEEEIQRVESNRGGAVTREEYEHMLKEGKVQPYKPNNYE